MIDWASERESMASNFAGRAQSASSYMLSSRASRRLKQEGDDAAEQMQQFKDEIQKRFLLSVSNKYYSFPYSQIAFDNPIEDVELQDFADKTLYCLYAEQLNPVDGQISQLKQPREQKQSAFAMVIQEIRSDRQKLNQILQLIQNRKNGRKEERSSKSKQKKLAYKYGVIHEQDEEQLRKRIYTQPYEKQAGFIFKKK